MKSSRSISVGMRLGVLVLALVAAIPEAMAQGCAMCYQNAAASGVQGRFALQHGILILFVPAIGFFGAIFFLLCSRHHFTDRDQSLAQNSNETVLREGRVHSHKE
jgi:ABC-type sulfate transport system permease subunit